MKDTRVLISGRRGNIDSHMLNIHETAIIDDGAKIGDGTRIWHWVHVCAGAQIGRNCIFGQNVYVGNKVRIGNGVKIQNNVSVYDNVTLKDHVFCGPSMVFTNALNPRAAISQKGEYIDTVVERGASLGANCTIICGVTIGEYAFVGAGAVVTHDVPAYALMIGVPARQVGWVNRLGERLDLPLSNKSSVECVLSGNRYVLTKGSLSVDPQ